MFNLEFCQAALEQLNQAIYNHEQWYKDLTRTIICRLPYDQRDVAEDAHHQCRFGQWYYSSDSQAFRDFEAFIALDAEHARMHQLAARLLRASANGESISLINFDNFSNSLDRLCLQLYSLKREIEDSLFRRDLLTGAESRIDMLTHLRQMLEMVKRRVQQCSIALMDLDHFKLINDNYGHIIGDQVLKASVHYVKENIHPYEKVFRYGGDEFLISMPNADLDSGQATIERIREGLATTTFAHEGIKPIFVTASFGIVLLDPDVMVEDSIDRADKALYAAKIAGRNRVRIWESSLQP